MNNKGISLPGVMMAGGLLAALSVVFMQMQSDMHSSNRMIEANSELISIVNEMKSVLSNEESCKESFLGKDAKSGTISSLKYKNKSGAFVEMFKDRGLDSHVRYGQGKIAIEGFQLSDVDSEVDVATKDTTHLLIHFNRGKAAKISKITKKIKLVVEVSAGLITNCRALLTSDGIWKQSKTNPLDVYYQGGNIGIGTDTPNAALDIAGAIKIGDGVCDTSKKGSVRYDEVSDSMQFCNSTGSWSSFSISADPLYQCPTDSSGMGSNGYSVKVTQGCVGQISKEPTCSNRCHSVVTKCWKNGTYVVENITTLDCVPLN